MPQFTTTAKNSKLILLLFFITACILPFSATRAHEFKTDGSISALLHINPDDDPIVAEPSEILFLISDTEKRFKAEDPNTLSKLTRKMRRQLIDTEMELEKLLWMITSMTQTRVM